MNHPKTFLERVKVFKPGGFGDFLKRTDFFGAKVSEGRRKLCKEILLKLETRDNILSR